MPRLTPHYQFIAVAPTIARGFTEQATGNPQERQRERSGAGSKFRKGKRRARPDQ